MTRPPPLPILQADRSHQPTNDAMKTLFAALLLCLTLGACTNPVEAPTPDIVQVQAVPQSASKEYCSDEDTTENRRECYACERRGWEWDHTHHVCFPMQ